MQECNGNFLHCKHQNSPLCKENGYFCCCCRMLTSTIIMKISFSAVSIINKGNSLKSSTKKKWGFFKNEFMHNVFSHVNFTTIINQMNTIFDNRCKR